MIAISTRLFCVCAANMISEFIELAMKVECAAEIQVFSMTYHYIWSFKQAFSSCVRLFLPTFFCCAMQTKMYLLFFTTNIVIDVAIKSEFPHLLEFDQGNGEKKGEYNRKRAREEKKNMMNCMMNV